MDDSESQTLIRICAIMIYKGSHGFRGQSTLSTQTRARFWAQVLNVKQSIIESFIAQARTLDGHTYGIVSDKHMMEYWKALEACNAMSCQAVFKNLRKEYSK